MIGATYWLALLLAGIAAATCIYLLIKSFSPDALPGCGPASGCDAVLGSRWARIGMLPVATPAMLMYLTILILWLTGRGQQVGYVLALTAGGAGVWFILLQVLALRRLCPYCMTVHACGIALAAIAVLQSRGSVPMIDNLIAMGLVLGFVVLQVLLPGRTYAIQQTGPMRPRENAADAVQAGIERTISLGSGKASLALSEWPLMGRADAPHVLAKLFDYTCEECRRLHEQLRAVPRRYNDQVAVLLVPMPLDFSCNPAVWPQDPRHVNACIYVRYALAMWRSHPEYFAEYDQWLCQGAAPPTIFAAQSRAVQMIGSGDFAAAMGDAQMERMLKRSIEIYRATGAGPLPKLLLPSATILGRFQTVKQLHEVLEKQLGLTPPAEKPPKAR